MHGAVEVDVLHALEIGGLHLDGLPEKILDGHTLVQRVTAYNGAPPVLI